MRRVHYYVDLVWHARYATTDANLRTRATLQMVRYLSGQLPRIPSTAVEVYSELVHQLLLFLCIRIFRLFHNHSSNLGIENFKQRLHLVTPYHFGSQTFRTFPLIRFHFYVYVWNAIL